MMNRILRFALLGVVVLMPALATWISVFLPARVMKQTQYDFLGRTGRTLNVAGGTSLEVSPSFGVALHDISVAGASALADPVVNAKALFIPISLAQAFGFRAPTGDVLVDVPVFTMSVNSEGRSNIYLGGMADAKTDVNAPLPGPTLVNFQNGTFIYKDEVKAKIFTFSEADGLIAVDAQQEMTLKSAAALGGQRVHFQGVLHSLPRAFADGSPLDFNLDGVGSAFGFSGRVVAAKNIDLAGQATVDTDDAARLFKWLGVEVHGLSGKYPLVISSAVETQGSVFLLKKADVQFAGMKGQGDVSFSPSGPRPSLTLALSLDELNTDLYALPVKGLAPIGSWNDRPFDLSDFKTLDMQFRIATSQARFGEFIFGPAEIDGELKDGVLTTTINSETSGKADVIFDAAQTPPNLKLNLDLKNVEAKTFMPRFAGMNWLQGPMRLSASLAAEGASQAEMIGNLKGSVDAQIDHARIQGVELGGLAAHVQSEAVSGWEGATTDPVVGNVKLSLVDGVATLQENVITAPGVKTSQSGEIDILRQALNLEATLALNRGDGKPMKIKITGPWAKPSFALVNSNN